jgi:hypothetical protein
MEIKDEKTKRQMEVVLNWAEESNASTWMSRFRDGTAV